MIRMVLLQILLLLLHSGSSQYSISFASVDDILEFKYPSPVDYTVGQIQFQIALDKTFKSGAWSTGDTDVLTVESEQESEGKFDMILIKSTVSYQGNIVTASIHAKLSNPGTNSDSGFCLTTMGSDLDDRSISFDKNNASLAISVDGYTDPIYCLDQTLNSVDKRSTMRMSTIKVTNVVGCFSVLSLPEIDFLTEAVACGETDYLSAGVTFHSGSDCSDDLVCPTTPPPVEPTTEEVTTEGQAITTHKPATTESGVVVETDDEETKEKEKEDEEEDEENNEEEEDQSEDEKEKEDDDTKEEDDGEKDTDTGNVVNPEEDKKDNGEDDTVIVIEVVPDGETDDEVDPGYTGDEGETNEVEPNQPEEVVGSEEDSGAPSQNRSIVIIVIVVVISGIVIVIILLYVGYRFHFRDKGSYKLEEAKGGAVDAPAGDDFAPNEYCELTPNAGKDQEWYL